MTIKCCAYCAKVAGTSLNGRTYFKELARDSFSETSVSVCVTREGTHLLILMGNKTPFVNLKADINYCPKCGRELNGLEPREREQRQRALLCLSEK